MKILIVEDETLLAQSLRTLLEKNGYEAETVNDGDAGAAYGCLGIYDLVILDVMLPGMNGYQIAKKMRQEHVGTPILMLTARTDLDDRITGLDSGADYYLPKPFDTRELLACIGALLRRQGREVSRMTFGNTALDLSSATLNCGGEKIRLSAKEFEIMRCLIASGKNNLSKETILTKVWGFQSEAVENNVEVYVGFLRKKLQSIGSDIRIAAIRNLGYHLEAGAL